MTQGTIILEHTPTVTAEILRQEMRAIGGGAAVGRNVIEGQATHRDVILTGTAEQLRILCEKIPHPPLSDLKLAQGIREAMDNSRLERLILKTPRREVILGPRTLIMGILNVTPDSFSDGGRFFSPTAAIEAGLRMVEEGADMIDIGGESTRPGSEPVPPDEELRRVIPVIRHLASRTDIPLSIDTMKAAVARAALAEGAEIINDVSSMGFDPLMSEVVAVTNAAVILMHMRGNPKTMQTGDLVYRSLYGEVIRYLRNRIVTARSRGIEPDRIMVDPGLGFGKTAADNLRLIRHMRELTVLGRPIVTGASRKSFIGHVTGGNTEDRLEGTAAAITVAILNGSRVVRVHDVAAMRKVAAMADALRIA